MSVVSFDLDETLVTCSEPRERSFEHVRSELDASVPLPAVEAYRTAFREALEGRLPDRAADGPVRRAAFESAFEAVGASVTDSTVEAFADAYRRRRLDRLAPMDGAPGLLGDLSGKRRVLVVTNGPADLQREKLRRTALARSVDAMAVAGRCGVRKPDPELFRVAFERAGATTSGSVHVGDSRSDVEGARAAGLDPILLDTEGRAPPGWLPDGVPVCRSLASVRRTIRDHARGGHSSSE
jgi:HAD superfamily hydrolase (TIGR01549 family)